MSRLEYSAFVDLLAQQIASGALRPGDRLPTQRAFAFKHGIAASTAGRVYAELLRRGLVIGEVGRGTFVAAPLVARVRPDEAMAQRFDLEFNFPTIAEQHALIARSVSALHAPDVLSSAMAPVTAARLSTARGIAARAFTTPHWQPVEDSFQFTGGGRQSIAATLSAVVPKGGRLGVEAISYPLVKHIAPRLGIALAPLLMDDDGILPNSIERTHRAGRLSAIYLQPVLHNPLGHTMGRERRREILSLATRHGILLIEDYVYGFLRDDPPLAAEAPDRCIVVGSLAKVVAAGMGFGWIALPQALRDRLPGVSRSGAWSINPFALEMGTRMLADGTVAEIALAKRADARTRQALAAECLTGIDYFGDPAAYHLWLRLPNGWRSEAFVAAAARVGVQISPSSAFAMAPGHAPNAVRLAMGLPPHAELRTALTRLARLLRAGPEIEDTTE